MKKLRVVSKNPAVMKISGMLEEAFLGAGERVRKELIDAYRGYAVNSFESFIQAIKTRKGEWEETDRQGRRRKPFGDWHQYGKLDASSYSPFRTWEDLRALLPKFSLDLSYADREANDAYEHARDSFVFKNIGKVENVLGKRSDLKNAVVKFEWRNGSFDGNLQVYLEGAYFRAEISLKYVIRTIPRVTPYFQYPLVFTEAEVAGKHYARPSEEELRVLLSGVSSEKHEAEKLALAAQEGWCPMSGKAVPEALYRPVARRMSPYVRCTGCGVSVSAQRGVYRKHKTPAFEKRAAAQKLESAGYCPKSREKVGEAAIRAMGPVEPYKDPKIACEGCGQMTRLDAERDWIPAGGDRYPTQMKVKSARYYKHRLPK